MKYSDKMLDSLADMVRGILKGICDDESGVKVQACVEHEERFGKTREVTVLEIKVADNDFRKVVGKQGQMISAIKFIVYAACMKYSLPVCEIILDDPDVMRRYRRS